MFFSKLIQGKFHPNWNMIRNLSGFLQGFEIFVERNDSRIFDADF